MLRRVVDLRDVVHRRHAGVELAERAEQLVDVDVLRPVLRREGQQDELEVGGAAAARAGAVVDQHAIGEKAAQRRLEQVVVGVDEAGHHDAAARIDLGGAAGMQSAADGDDLAALDQHVGLWEVAHLGVHRHHGAAADHVTTSPLAAAVGLPVIVCRRRSRREQTESRRGHAAGCRRFQEVAPRTGMVLRQACITELAHVVASEFCCRLQRSDGPARQRSRRLRPSRSFGIRANPRSTDARTRRAECPC